MQQINNINVDGKDEFFCFIWGGYPYKLSKKNMIEYLTNLMKLQLSNSVINTNKSMLISTVLFSA